MKKSLIILLVFINISCLAQSRYQVLSDSELIVKGTSTLHDWVMETRKVEGDGTFIINGSNIKEINNLSISMAAEDLKAVSRVWTKKLIQL